MHTKRTWTKLLCSILLFSFLFQIIGLPLMTADLLDRAAQVAQEYDQERLAEGLADAGSQLSPRAQAAPLQHDPGDTSSESEDEDTCDDGASGGSVIQYSNRSLNLSHTIQSVGPPLMLRYESRYAQTPLPLAVWVPTQQPIEFWEIDVLDWHFEGEGAQPLAFWDTTDAPGGDPVPEGLYYYEVTYGNQESVGSTMHSVLVKRAKDGPLGYNWSHNYQLRLEQAEDDSLILQGFGFWTHYSPSGGDTWEPCCTPGDRIVQQEDGTYVWQRDGRDGSPIRGDVLFDAQGRAISFTNQQGREIALDYEDDRLVAVTDDLGRSTQLSYVDGHLTQVTDAAGNAWQLDYDSGDLVGVQDPLGGQRSFAYDDDHHVFSQTDALGYSTQYRYDGGGAIGAVIDPAGNEMRLATVYHEEPYLSEDPSQQRPALGTTTISYHDAQGIETARRAVSFDNEGRILQIVESPNGGGTPYVWRYTWGTGNQSDNLVRMVDPAGRVSEYKYESNTKLPTLINVPGQPEQGLDYRYNSEFGWQVTRIDRGLGTNVQLSYDDQGRLQEIRRSGARVYYRYEGNAPGDQPSALIWNWDGEGDPTQASEARILQMEYDELGRLTAAIDPAGNRYEIEYNDLGQPVVYTDALGRTTRFAYDALGRIASITDAAEGVTRYSYDAVGNLMAVTDAAGNVTRYSYDHKGRLIACSDPLGRTMRYGYNSQGYLIWKEDARGARLRYQRDGLGRITAVHFPSGQSWRYTYDASGLVTGIDDGTTTLSYSYDRQGELLRESVSRLGRTNWVDYEYNRDGQVDALYTSQGLEINYGYDTYGQMDDVRTPLGNSSLEYENVDSLLPLLSSIEQEDLQTELRYDELGRLVEQIHTHRDWENDVSEILSYRYDAVGNLASRTDSDGTSMYGYDTLNRLSQVTTSDGQETSYNYDAVGNRVEASGNEAVNYRYDAANQLLQAADMVYRYDANGYLIGAWQGDQAQVYAWDYQGRLRAVGQREAEQAPYPLSLGLADAEQPELLRRYSYDALGRRVATWSPDGRQEHLYAHAHRLQSLAADGSLRHTSVYGAYWDQTLALSQNEELDEEAALYPMADQVDTLLGAVDADGQQLYVASYDPWGQPLQRQADSPLAGFQGRPYDEETGLYDFRARAYDPALGRFISPDPYRQAMAPGGLNAYTFGMNNPLRYTDPEGELVPLIIAAALIGAAGYAAYQGTDYYFSTPDECFSAGEMAWRIGSGAAIGGLLGAGGFAMGALAPAGIASGVGIGAFMGFSESILRQGIIDKKVLDPNATVDWGDVGKSVVVGGITGGVGGYLLNPANEATQLVGGYFVDQLGGAVLGESYDAVSAMYSATGW